MRASVKLIICYVITVVALFTIVNLVGTEGYEKKIEERTVEEYKGITDFLNDYVTEALYVDKVDFQSDVKPKLIKIAELINARMIIVNGPTMAIAMDTAYDNAKPFSDLDSFDRTLLNQVATEHVEGQGLFKEPVIFINMPIMYKYQFKGYLFVAYPESLIHEQAVESMDTINKCMLWAAVVIFAAFVVVFLITVLPIRKIRKAAVEYSKGNYDYKLKVRTHDEFRDLSDTIRFMVDKLNDTEETQKKFIANISHDFRSPLTSIKGYAEAIKDGTIPYENKDKYLDVILFESDRLHKLTSSILELNTIDNGKMALDIRSFDITRIIRVIADTFEGTCRKKKITIRLLFDESEIYVDGDMGRIEQVIYNLVDNAIKFSDTDSELIIGVQIKGSKAYVRVKDSGCGISKENLTKIWDRFYKSDESRGKDKKGTGLGLSIVKEIIQAHDENINVVSTLGVGTEFTFTLSLS